MHQKVLIVEDDLDIAHLLRVHVSELDLEVDHLASGEGVMSQLTNQNYAIVLLDIMLPSVDGLTLCREIKTLHPKISVVMLTSKSSEMDRIIGLEMGADDYICKPFSYREFQARIKAQLRHVKLLQAEQSSQVAHDTPAPITVGNLQVDPHCHEVSLHKQPLDLTATEFDLLMFFAKHPNQVFSRSQLLESVWGYDHLGYEHTVNSHINRIRTKLEKLTDKPIIETVWGVGYKLNSKPLQQEMI
ncbi:DNA-binding response regulator [Pseudoalteromonas luteoviolacea]|uniref:Phosphate regulon transcriptional regulatory protein PhoB n=1 Tax=Pseudoalteromonas luteoviolacea TaxID=43657 RepID=A0A1C0TMV7_9GAMM|nr:response regulator transcription factor [Pseudoalteromonas luteoviolacea]MBQ4812255.1 response regulator transcription factor [Pseudoalteromonas luteoviolacea]OCQ19997.1 DNA-binding response regulator [Pseudoalteromonas luteoviolacea]